MRTTMDAAGRVIIPKALRDEVGLAPGPVEVTRDGAGIRVQTPTSVGLTEERGRLVIQSSGGDRLDDESVRVLRDADER